GIKDHVIFKVQPFLAKAMPLDWMDFIDHVTERVQYYGVDLVIFDTISGLWPVVNENDAAQGQSSLMLLRGITRTTNAGLLFSHHLKKADGLQGTGFRGSSALGGFVDALVELRRCFADQVDDRRRRLSVIGRWPETPPELTILLNDDGQDYELLSGMSADMGSWIADEIRRLLPQGTPGITFEELVAAWKTGSPPRR